MECCVRGYSRLAAFLDSDENFMIYRRFGYIQSRLLLEKQDELRMLEDKLDILDREMYNQRDGDVTTRDLPSDIAAPRKELIQRIEEAFCGYGENSRLYKE